MCGVWCLVWLCGVLWRGVAWWDGGCGVVGGGGGFGVACVGLAWVDGWCFPSLSPFEWWRSTPFHPAPLVWEVPSLVFFFFVFFFRFSFYLDNFNYMDEEVKGAPPTKGEGEKKYHPQRE